MMKRFVICLLIFLCLVPDGHGQLFGRRRGYQPYCPSGECVPYSAPSSSGPAQDDVPEWAVKATCEVHAGSSGGTGGICHYDPETNKAYILTCRHVINQQTSPCYVKLSNGTKKTATFLGTSGKADLALLEIDGTGVTGFVEVYEGDIYNGQEVYQVGYGINATRAGGINKRSGRIVRPSGYVGESSYDVSFMLISGDSGSPIFDAKSKKLMGVGWGHDYRHGKITGPVECRCFLLDCLRRKNRNPPTIPPPTTEPSKPNTNPPTAPTKPVEPAANGCKCPPPTDTKPLTDAIGKLTEIATMTNQSVTVLGGKVDGIDKRLVAVERKQAAPAAPPAAAPPSTPDPRIGQIQSDLDKLRAALKRGGTLNLSVTPQ